MTIFTEWDHRLSIVPRWTIIHTLQKQSVAEHAFNVERIAVQIAKHWFMVDNVYMLYEISQWALHHDDDEATTGDIPSTVKSLFDGTALHLASRQPLMPKPDSSFIVSVVKLADYMEWIYFLFIERALGNMYIVRVLDNVVDKAYKYIEQEFDHDTKNNLEEWIQTLFYLRLDEFKGVEDELVECAKGSTEGL